MKKYDWKNEYNPIRRTAKRLLSGEALTDGRPLSDLIELDEHTRKRVSDYIRFALENADIYVAGSKISTKSKDVTSRISEAFEKLINSEYHKLKCMESQPSQSDIMDVLKQPKTQISMSDLGFGNERNHDALAAVIDEIRYAGAHAAQYSVKQALDQFMDPPYGYTEEDIEFLIATLYRKGQISLKVNSIIYTPATSIPLMYSIMVLFIFCPAM